MKREGEQVNFRPADDIFEEAATNLAEMILSASQDPSLAITVDDIMRFSALECTRHAMRRVCEVKGTEIGKLLAALD